MLTRSGAVPDCCLKDVPLLKLSPLVPVKHNSLTTTASHTSLVFRSRAEEGFAYLEDPWQGTCFQSRTTKPRNESTHFQMFVMFNRNLTTVNDWVTARAFFKAENPDLPDHFYEQYMPLYPRWGSACNEPGDVRSTQGLEKTWEHTKKKKKHHQKVNKNAKEIEYVCCGADNSERCVGCTRFPPQHQCGIRLDECCLLLLG